MQSHLGAKFRHIVDSGDDVGNRSCATTVDDFYRNDCGLPVDTSNANTVVSLGTNSSSNVCAVILTHRRENVSISICEVVTVYVVNITIDIVV